MEKGPTIIVFLEWRDEKFVATNDIFSVFVSVQTKFFWEHLPEKKFFKQ